MCEHALELYEMVGQDSNRGQGYRESNEGNAWRCGLDLQMPSNNEHLNTEVYAMKAAHADHA